MLRIQLATIACTRFAMKVFKTLVAIGATMALLYVLGVRLNVFS